jgi:hypothetical protein
MKSKTPLFYLWSFIFCLLLSPSPCALSQIPQGFNYQAVARNASGGLITNVNLPVRMSIQSDSLGGTIIWQELHSSVITTDQGVINLVIGKGARQSSSTVATFSAIDWGVTPKFLKIEIDYSGWKTLGVSRLWSVPYAMVAGDLVGPIEKLAIAGETSQLEEALFEVKNKDGQTVFAVYNEGVRVYVSDGAKAIKGGFAVGGFGTDKAESTKYLFVGKDSVRIYLDTNPLTKGVKSGFAVGGYDITKGTVQNYLDVRADSTRIYVKTQAKGTKGGFAVGGFDATKGPAIPFVDLTPDNYFIGHESGMKIKTGLYNSFLGYQAGKETTEGSYNIFIGHQSGYSNKLGSDNTFVGYQSGYSNLGNNNPGVFQHGKWNCYFGYKAGYSSQMGDFNTLVGYEAGFFNQASMNTFIGFQSGHANTEGTHNTFLGLSAGILNTTGNGNVFLGSKTGYGNKEGENNVYIGVQAGAYFSSGNNNIVIGNDAGAGTVYGGNGVGSNNVILGSEAGKYAHNGSSNVFIGNQAGYNENGSDLLIIENSSSSTPLVYGNFVSNLFRINGDIEALTVNTPSDIALKKNIVQLADVTEKLNLIRGVYFDWDLSGNIGLSLKEGRQIGIIAQEVEKVYPELVMINDKGFKMVDYSKLTPVLLEAIKEQQQQIDSYKSQLQSLQEKVEKIESLLTKTLVE